SCEFLLRNDLRGRSVVSGHIPLIRANGAASQRRSSALRAVALVAAVVAMPLAAFARQAPETFADLAEEVLPAVVNISTTQMVNRDSDGDRQEMPQLPPGSPFEDFFKDFFDRDRDGGDR